MAIKQEEQLMGLISERRLKGLEKKVIYYISQAACRINLQNHGRCTIWTKKHLQDLF